MATLISDDVFGRDGKEHRQEKQPTIMRVIEEQGNSRAGDEGAERNDFFLFGGTALSEKNEIKKRNMYQSLEQFAGDCG